MKSIYTLTIFTIGLITFEALALNQKDVVMFKGDSKGILHLIDSNSHPKVTVVLGNNAVCGSTQPNKPQKTKASTMKADPECKPNYASKVKFSKQHKFTNREIPLALGFKTCDVEVLRDNALHPSKKMIEDFKKNNRLPTYISEKSQIFSGKDGSRYLSFTGMIGKKKKSREPDLYKYEIDGVVKRDFLLYDLKNKQFVLNKRNQVCCDPATENVHLCSLPRQAKSSCFDPYKGQEKIKGLAKHNGTLYALAVDSGMEGVHGYVWELKDNKRQEVFHRSFYALEGCR